MRLGRDLAAGLAHSLITVLVGLAVVPFYIRFLGVEAYGLIGFNAALQAMLFMLDLGLAQAISREVARATASDDLPRARTLLHSLAWIYWGVAALIGAAIFLSAPAIAEGWLNPGSLGAETVTGAVVLMGLMIACRWPAALYFGALTGAHRLTVASALAAGYIVIANCGAVLVLAFGSATIEAFFLWQAGAALLYTLAIQFAAWRALGGASGVSFDLAAIKSIWRFSVGVGGVVLTGTIFMQLDKLILSNLVSLTEFGYYMLATLAAGVLYGLIRPLFNVIYPRFSSIVATGDEDRLAGLYRAASGLFALVWFPGAMAIILCAEPLLLVWTGDPEIAARAAPLLALLTAGIALHGMMYFPYALQLAYGLSRLPLTINLLLMIVQLPLIIVLSSRFGAMGAAVAWLILQILYVALGTWLTHRRLLTGVAIAWLGRDVGVPLAVAAATGLAGWQLVGRFPDAPLVQILIGGTFALLALLISAAFCPYKPREIRAVLSA